MTRHFEVRFSPESGHLQRNIPCPLWAGHDHRRAVLADQLPHDLAGQQLRALRDQLCPALA